jgi:hypothetical protein
LQYSGAVRNVLEREDDRAFSCVLWRARSGSNHRTGLCNLLCLHCTQQLHSTSQPSSCNACLPHERFAPPLHRCSSVGLSAYTHTILYVASHSFPPNNGPDDSTVRTCSVGVRGAECKFSALAIGSRIVCALYQVFWMSVDVALLLLLHLCHGAYRTGSALATTRATSQLHLQLRKVRSYDRYTRVYM